MATLKQIKEAVEKLLAQAGAKNALQFNNATRERAFEAYVFSLVVKSVLQATGSVAIKGIKSGANPNPIVLRGGPGKMSSAAQDFAFAQCKVNNTEFEIHIGVQYLGTSGALHEIDVSIYDREKAEKVREKKVLPDTRPLLAAIECKFYDSSLGVSLGRTFVGLVSDMGSLKYRALATNGRDTGLASYLSKNNRPDPYFQLTPLRPDVADRFVSALEQVLRKWCKVA